MRRAEKTAAPAAQVKSSQSKFTAAISKATCPPCDPNLFDFIEAVNDAFNGNVYCASPSGAFLE